MAEPLTLVLSVATGLALACLLAPGARAFELTAIRPARDAGGQLWVELQIEDPIEPRVARTLGRGMPATLTLHAELWRRRTGWFDRMERAVDATFRMHYDVWSDSWLLERPGATTLVIGTLDSLGIALGPGHQHQGAQPRNIVGRGIGRRHTRDYFISPARWDPQPQGESTCRRPRKTKARLGRPPAAV